MGVALRVRGRNGNILFCVKSCRSRSCPPPPPTATAPPRPRTRRAALPIDDTRIREIMELAPPAHLLREFPASDGRGATTYEARQAIHRVLHGADDRLLVVVGPCSIHDYDAAIDYATRLAALKRELADRPHRRDARLLREAAHDRRLEGPHQRPAPRRQLPHQRGPAARAPHPARDQRARAARRHRVPRHDHAAVHRRPHRLGRDRRAHDREPGAPRSSRRACRARSASRTAPTATCGSPSTRSRRPRRRTTSCR